MQGGGIPSARMKRTLIPMEWLKPLVSSDCKSNPPVSKEQLSDSIRCFWLIESCQLEGEDEAHVCSDASMQVLKGKSKAQSGWQGTATLRLLKSGT